LIDGWLKISRNGLGYRLAPNEAVRIVEDRQR